MNDRAHVALDRPKIAAFCRKWSVVEFALFGSVLRDDFRAESDVDVLVSFSPDVRWSLFDLATMEEELGRLFGRKVDLVERRSVEHSENYIRRHHVLDSLEPIYVA
jgi:uncharacterized protein